MLTNRNGQTRAGYQRCTRCRNWTQCECGANSADARRRQAQEQREREDREDAEADAWLRRHGRDPRQKVPTRFADSERLQKAIRELRR